MVTVRLLCLLLPAGVDSEAGGFPNVEFNSNSSVEGVVYLLRQEELKVLDSAMGYPQVLWLTLSDICLCVTPCVKIMKENLSTSVC